MIVNVLRSFETIFFPWAVTLPSTLSIHSVTYFVDHPLRVRAGRRFAGGHHVGDDLIQYSG